MESVVSRVRLCLLLAALVALPVTAHAQWKPVEKVETYAISGQSGPELYRSIGENGPNVGVARAIAHTNFKLTWTRDYQARAGACVLVSAKPKLIITYTLPSPSAPLPPAIQKNWEVFLAGVSAHEKVHGATIVDMVRKIEAATVGLTVADDAKCSKIRAEMTKRLSALSQAQRQASRDFDRVELGPGGNLQKLILALVNGG
ncbi:peptidase [Mesorhizobium sp. WSM4308]|nr:peptidase [Mesorhizobium sp. WSM4304]PBB73900.1 peptidase [Mesorhizobium sp. WSM4308]